MGEHYPLCERYISGDDLPCICELLSEHADLMVGAAMADLRTKVDECSTIGEVIALIDKEAERG